MLTWTPHSAGSTCQPSSLLLSLSLSSLLSPPPTVAGPHANIWCYHRAGLQQYHHHPAPLSVVSSASSSPFCRSGRHRSASRGQDKERVPARLRRDGGRGGYDALADAGAAVRPSRHGVDAGARWEKQLAGGTRGVVCGEEGEEEEVEAPVRLTSPQSVWRPVSRGMRPPSRVAEAKCEVAAEEEEEEMLL